MANDKQWVVEEVKEGFQFDPIAPGRYAEGVLLLGIPKIIVVSATLRPKTMYMMGIGKENFEFKEFDSVILTENAVQYTTFRQCEWTNEVLTSACYTFVLTRLLPNGGIERESFRLLATSGKTMLGLQVDSGNPCSSTPKGKRPRK